MKNKITRRDFIKTSLGTAAGLSLTYMGLPELIAQTLEKTEIYPDLAVVTNGDPASLTRNVMELLGGMKRFVYQSGGGGRGDKDVPGSRGKKGEAF
jgi:hypothetical protein